jgi:hypothetical protein
VAAVAGVPAVVGVDAAGCVVAPFGDDDVALPAPADAPEPEEAAEPDDVAVCVAGDA